MVIATLHPVAPAPPPGGSLSGWVLLAVLLGLIAICGMVFTSRR
jgi:hypothetical protein